MHMRMYQKSSAPVMSVSSKSDMPFLGWDVAEVASCECYALEDIPDGLPRGEGVFLAVRSRAPCE
jgi:hypothetical protein